MAIFTLTIDAPDLLPVDADLVVYGTPPLSKGITRPDGRWFRFVAAAFMGGMPTDITAGYVAAFGSPIVGQRFWLRCKFVALDTGFASDWQMFMVDVV